MSKQNRKNEFDRLFKLNKEVPEVLKAEFEVSVVANASSIKKVK